MRKRSDIRPTYDRKRMLSAHEDDKRPNFPEKRKLERYWPIIVALLIMVLMLVYFR
jgi:hypothetical protein